MPKLSFEYANTGAAEPIKKWYGNRAVPVDGGGRGGEGVAYHTIPDQSSHTGLSMLSQLKIADI